jgi:small subunit ribosomal protein S4
MGKPKFSKKTYETPNHPWKETRIKEENELVAKYGLKNKREIWKAETSLRNYRGQARGLLAKMNSDDPQTKKELHQLLSHLIRYNILPLNSTLDDVLALNTEDILNRRLQTLTYLKGFASTPKQARQLINHGHIAIDGRGVNVPGFPVSKNEEKDIAYALDSPLNDQAHPARPSGDFVSKIPPEPSVETPDQPTDKSREKKPTEKPRNGKKPKKTVKKPEEKPQVEQPEKPGEKVKEKKEQPVDKPEEKPKKKKDSNDEKESDT